MQDVFKKENVQALKRVYNHGIIGRNVNQHTVIIDRVGSIKLSELHKIVTDEQFVGYINQRMLHLSQSVLKEKEQVIWIIDLAGPILQLASKKVYLIIEKITINLQKYFPHILHKYPSSNSGSTLSILPCSLTLYGIKSASKQQNKPRKNLCLLETNMKNFMQMLTLSFYHNSSEGTAVIESYNKLRKIICRKWRVLKKMRRKKR